MREREEKKKKGGRGKKFRSIRLYSTHSLTQLWLLNVVKKDRGLQNFRVLLSEQYAVLLLTTNYYELNPPELREPIAKLPISFQQTLTRATRVPLPSERQTLYSTLIKTLGIHNKAKKGKSCATSTASQCTHVHIHIQQYKTTHTQLPPRASG